MFLWLPVMLFCVLLIACSPSKKTSSSVKINPAEVDTVAGLKGIRSSDCFTCHSFSERLIGPSFTDIAKKYDLNSANVQKLSEKIRNGGSGSWGNIPMTPHPAMTESEANTIVKYILLLKK